MRNHPQLAIGVFLLAACHGPASGTPVSAGRPAIQERPSGRPASRPIRIADPPVYETSTLRLMDVPATAPVIWRVNGEMLPQVTAHELTGVWFGKHEVVECEVRFGKTVRVCEPLRISNSAPNLETVRIAGQSYLPWDTFHAVVDGWDDADGDPPGYRFEWRINGVPAGRQAPAFWDLSLIPGDRLAVLAIPTDGELEGPPIVSESVWVRAAESPAQINAFTVSPATVVSSEPAEIHWEVTSADGCVLSSLGPLDTEELSGGTRNFFPFESTAVTLYCSGAGGATAATVSIAVLPAPPQIIHFGFNPSAIEYGAGTVLRWESSGTASCVLSEFGAIVGTGETLLSPSADTEYTFTCSGPGGVSSSVARLGVNRPVINEVAWMGTAADANDEWIEIFNGASTAISLEGWRLASLDGTPNVLLSGSISPGEFVLLERTSDDTVPGIAADFIYSGSLGNTGEALILYDADGRVVDTAGSVPWPAGDALLRATMERLSAWLPANDGNWSAATLSYSGGYGTPRGPNAFAGYPMGGTSLTEIEVIWSDHKNARMPGHGPGFATAALVAAIDAAVASIDFALYGLQGSPEILDALGRAAARGVTIRGVVDADLHGWFAYRNTGDLLARLPPGSVRVERDDRLMHNKFLVLDGESVWTGSMNISDADLNAEYNCNLAVLIRNAPLAAAYREEFERMFAGQFHNAKAEQSRYVFPRLADGTLVESYFAPAGDARRRAFRRAIDTAAASIDVIMYFFTDNTLRDALLEAKQRGVAVRVILDATGAAHPASVHEELRDAGIPVKVEDWPGKAHTKAIVSDGFRVAFGSQNWTESGNDANDENVLYVENVRLGESVSEHFNADWYGIPVRWLSENPRPESSDSPGSLADLLDNDHDGLADEGAPAQLSFIDQGTGAINAYFSEPVLHEYARIPGNFANGSIDLSQRFLTRIQAVTSSVDLAVYELDLPEIVDALRERASAGVTVRVIVDAKAPHPLDIQSIERYEVMRLFLERLIRGSDGTPGTDDDVHIFADSPVWAVTTPTVRTAYGLPETPEGLPWREVMVGSRATNGYLVSDAERKSGAQGYYAAGEQMHHKFAVLDREWVWTGSWNPTVASTYGSDVLMTYGILGGASDHAVELRTSELAAVFEEEFTLMWGAASVFPDPVKARFHQRKPRRDPVSLAVGSRTVTVVFAPGPLQELLVEQVGGSQWGAYFTVFAWSDLPLLSVMKHKWDDIPGYRLAGVFDRRFWREPWSASTAMSVWNRPPPVISDGEDFMLHSKVLVLDPGLPSAKTVFGSANWTNNGFDVNDENLLVVSDANVADQFMQHFWARYFRAGGRLPW